MQKKRILVGLLIGILLVGVITNINYSQYEDILYSKAHEGFQGEDGVVRTLIAIDEENYYIKTENFDKFGNYKEPAERREISYKEYADLRASKKYDILKEDYILTLAGKAYDIYHLRDLEGNYLEGSYVGEILAGTKNIPTDSLSALGYKEVIVLETKSDYYKETVMMLNKDGKTNGIIREREITEEEYTEKLVNKKFDYIKELRKYRDIEGHIFRVTKYIDTKYEVVKKPYSIYEVAKNMEDFFKEDEPEIDPEDGTGEGEDGGESPTGPTGPVEPSEPWKGSFVDWVDVTDTIEYSTFDFTDVDGVQEASESAYADLSSMYGERTEIDTLDISTVSFTTDGGEIVVGEDGILRPSGMDGEYNEDGDFVLEEEDTIVGKDGVLHPTLDSETEGYYDEDGNFVMEEEGKYITPDGEVMSIAQKEAIGDREGYYKDGKFMLADGSGYYDEDGVFHALATEEAGESPTVLDGAVSKESLGDDITDLEDGQLSNGVVVQDGQIGYYDEDGNFVPGELQEDGTYILADGTVVDADGNILKEATDQITEVDSKLYDEDGNLVGEVQADGTVVLPDGTVLNEDGEVIGRMVDGEFVGGALENGEVVLETGETYTPEDIDPALKSSLKGEQLRYDSQGNLIKEDGIVVNEQGVEGYYNAQGEFVAGQPPEDELVYDADGNLILDDGKSKLTSDGKIITKDGKEVTGKIDSEGRVQLADGTIVSGSGKVGYYDADGNFVEGVPTEGTEMYDANGNLIGTKGEGTGDAPYQEDGFTDADGNYILSDGSGYYDADGNFVAAEDVLLDEQGKILGKVGKAGVVRDADGNIIGQLDADGNLVRADGSVVSAEELKRLSEDTVGSFNTEGEFQEGILSAQGGALDSQGNPIDGQEQKLYYNAQGELVAEKPSDEYYYDAQGNKHYLTEDGQNVYQDQSGNVHLQEEKGIGYINADGEFHKDGQDGYYDIETGQYMEDGEEYYYDENGVRHKGKNPYVGGYYDEDGNWHKLNEVGYVDGETGQFIKNVSGDSQGHYNADGELVEGPNPYADGYYDADGNFHYYDDETGGVLREDGTYESPDGTLSHYNEKGELVEGANPNEDYHYDKYGNVINDETDHRVTYYDKDGNEKVDYKKDSDYYYDNKGNLHKKGTGGYFDSTGTYRRADGSYGYFDEEGNFVEGYTNPYIEGYYDSEGNFHRFGEEGYYDEFGYKHLDDGRVGYYGKDGKFIEGTLPENAEGYYDSAGVFHEFGKEAQKVVNDRYKKFIEYLNSDIDKQINWEFTGRTLQYNINRNDTAKNWIDTGIHIQPTNQVYYVYYKDLLMLFSQHSNNANFYDMGDEMILVYDGRIISVHQDEIMSLGDFNQKLIDSPFEVAVRNSEVGTRNALHTYLKENKSDLSVYFKGKEVEKNNIILHDNTVYFKLTDFSKVMNLDLERQVTKQATYYKITNQDANGRTIEFKVDSPTIKVNEEIYRLDTSPIEYKHRGDDSPAGISDLYIQTNLFQAITSTKSYLDMDNGGLFFEETRDIYTREAKNPDEE